MSGITTHVLDTARGRPAGGLEVTLERMSGGVEFLGQGRTDENGRLRDLLPDGEALEPGVYRLTFLTGDWFRAQGIAGFYPEVAVMFEVRDPGEHHHVPLLLSPFGYSTYRGS